MKKMWTLKIKIEVKEELEVGGDKEEYKKFIKYSKVVLQPPT